MIEARPDPGAALVARLTAKAECLGKARAQARDPRRWRRAGWLWPLFTRER